VKIVPELVDIVTEIGIAADGDQGRDNKSGAATHARPFFNCAVDARNILISLKNRQGGIQLWRAMKLFAIL
jgi:hypothetical protein